MQLMPMSSKRHQASPGISDEQGKKRMTKKRKLDGSHMISTSSPKGLIWEKTLSCAYDSLLTILHNIFAENEDHWFNHLSNFNDFFSIMSEGWQNNEQESLESVRDRIRYPLSQRDPASFPYNEREGTDVYALIDQVFSSPTYQSSTEESCPHCHDILNRSTSSSPFWHLEGKASATISKQLQDTLNTQINKDAGHV